MDIRIQPGPLRGTVTAPPSKSAAHRLALCAALASGSSTLHGVARSQDLLATLEVARALGAKIEEPGGGALVITGPPSPPGETVRCDCRESGSTLRFMVPVAAALGIRAEYVGRGRLPERPIAPLAETLERHGARFSRRDGMPFTVEGRLTPGRYELPGDVSSQYVTGLLLALPLLEGDSEIVLTTPLQSAGYVEMTLEALRRFGVRVERASQGWRAGSCWRVPGGQSYVPCEARVEGDWSNGAFWLCAAFLGSRVRVEGLDRRSVQGDRAAADILRAFAKPGDARVDAGDIPDLIPALCVAAAGRRGTTRFVNAARLRLKECDRLSGMARCIEALGGRAREWQDGLAVSGGDALRGGVVDSLNDHRLVMAAAVASTICREPVTVLGAQAVEKSYPDFFDRFRDLGGKFDVL